MTDIEPALTKYEWRSPVAYEDDCIMVGVYDGELIVIVTAPDGNGFVLNAAKVMALANHALPDGDPRKITRRTVIAMTQAAYFIEESDGHLSTHWAPDANPWRTLATELRNEAAKLAALLPPDHGDRG